MNNFNELCEEPISIGDLSKYYASFIGVEFNLFGNDDSLNGEILNEIQVQLIDFYRFRDNDNFCFKAKYEWLLDKLKDYPEDKTIAIINRFDEFLKLVDSL